jgi:hydrogenase maturation protease
MTVASASPVSVVGAGHWLISYDRIGPRVLALIRGRYGPEVEICELGNTGFALLDHLRGQDLMLVVDACFLGGRAGEVRVIEPVLPTLDSRVTSVHQVGPLEALAVADRLFKESMPHRVVLIAVETEGVDKAAEWAACQRVVSILDREIDAWWRAHSEN